MQALYRDPYEMFFPERKIKQSAPIPSKANNTKVRSKSYFENRAKNIIDRHTKTSKSDISNENDIYGDWPSMSKTKKNLNIKEPTFLGSYRKHKGSDKDSSLMEVLDDVDSDVDIDNEQPLSSSNPPPPSNNPQPPPPQHMHNPPSQSHHLPNPLPPSNHPPPPPQQQHNPPPPVSYVGYYDNMDLVMHVLSNTEWLALVEVEYI